MGLGDASAGLGLHHQDFLPKSLSTHEALFLRRCRRDISEAHFRAVWRQALPGMPAMLGPRSTKLCKYRQKLLCWAVCCCSVRFAVAVLVFGPSGARARPQPQNAAISFAFPGWLAGCSFWAAFSERARAPMSAFWVGARLGPGIPCII